MPYFGSKVIGKKAFERAEKIEKLNITTFGPKVAGDAHAELAKLDAAEKAPQGPQTPSEGSYRVEDIQKSLEENPALADDLYAAELSRPDGPRKTALRLFLQAEYQREGGLRGERQQEIEQLLKPQPDDPDG